MSLEIQFYGHKNIRALHETTIEITKDSNLTTRGDCIVGVNASHSCNDLPNEIKKKLRDPNSEVSFSFIVNNLSFVLKGKGHQDLTLSHSGDIVLRKSDFICSRTIAVNCNKASTLLPRKMIQQLQNPETIGILRINVD